MPLLVKVRLRSLYDLPDHPIYHPEGSTGNHIQIVLKRVAWYSSSIDLIYVALLHDICKGDAGQMKSIPEGDYWQNVDHAEMAVELILTTPEIISWIEAGGGDLFNIVNIVDQHMRVKSYLDRIDKIHNDPTAKTKDRNKVKSFTYENLVYLSDLREFAEYDKMDNPKLDDNNTYSEFNIFDMVFERWLNGTK